MEEEPPAAQKSSQALNEHIKEIIQKQGPITFAQFMELALYHPQWGYYMQPRSPIGPQGDYYTSPHVHPLFGHLLADQLAQMWDLLGQPRPFTVVEFGAGRGLMASDILDGLARRWPQCLASTRYIIVERSPNLIGEQKRKLADSPLPPERVFWLHRLDELPDHGSWAGCVLSNEFLDSLPVHRVRFQNGRIKEIYVTYNQGYTEVADEPSQPLLSSYFSCLGIELAEGQEAEVNLAALSWLEEVAESLERGFVLTIDYGYPAAELYGPRFPRGTLIGYHKHRPSEDFYAKLGQQDLTAHVDFTSLMRKGKELGLETTGFTAQMKFLLALGILKRAQEWDHKESDIQLRLAWKRLIMPDGMGEVFKVLIQHKGIQSPRLIGLSSPW